MDPHTETILARAADDRGRHPLHHATMLCIDQISQAEKRAMQEHTSKRPALGDDGAPRANIDPHRAEDWPHYLCTGLELYITREPCIMQVIHSIRRTDPPDPGVQWLCCIPALLGWYMVRLMNMEASDRAASCTLRRPSIITFKCCKVYWKPNVAGCSHRNRITSNNG